MRRLSCNVIQWQADELAWFGLLSQLNLQVLLCQQLGNRHSMPGSCLQRLALLSVQSRRPGLNSCNADHKLLHEFWETFLCMHCWATSKSATWMEPWLSESEGALHSVGLLEEEFSKVGRLDKRLPVPCSSHICTVTRSFHAHLFRVGALFCHHRVDHANDWSFCVQLLNWLSFD